MSDETLEQASTGRAKCKSCKEPIAKDAWRLRIAMASGQFDGDMVAMHHAVCGAMRKPTGFLRALVANREIAQPLREALRAIANATLDKKLVQVVWRHATEPRCLLELAKQRYVLVTQRGGAVLSLEGSLDEMIASVPDEDLAEVVDTAVASGKAIGKAAAKPAKPAKATKAKSSGAIVRQVFRLKPESTGDSTREIILDEPKLRVSRGVEGGPFKHKKFATVELAQKYFRYLLSQMWWDKVDGDAVELDPDEDFKDVKDKSPDYRYLEHATTKQFWEIERDEMELHFAEGPIGTKGTVSEEVCDWDGEAKQRWKELLAEKLAAGYVEPPGFAARRAAGNK